MKYRTCFSWLKTQVNDRNELTGPSRSGTTRALSPFELSTLNYQPSTCLSGTTGLRQATNAWDEGVTDVTVSGTGLVSGAAALYQDGSWARQGAVLQNGNNSYTALAQDTYGRESTDTVSIYSPATVSFAYDLNGNLTGDGKRVFEYDYENQLTNVYVANQWRAEFVYDALMRRRVRKDYGWSGSAWVKTNEVRYVYDGRLVVQERDENNVSRVTYTRGLDLSGTLEGAGGIGGLLARSEISNLKSPHAYYHADGNGNVTCMVDGDGTVVARYSYDPYGNILSMNGPLAEANLYRFSGKEWHVNSGLVYYLYRYYEPNLQRWLNQDPIGEWGGINLFSFVDNFPSGEIDFHGLDGIWITCADGTKKVIGKPSLDALTKELEKAAKDKNPITDLTIKGHGNSGEIKLNSKESLTTSGSSVLAYDKKKDSVKDITDLMNKSLSPNACVNVLGCSTGRGKDNLSQELSTALPDRIVIGSASFAQMNIPGQPATIGVKAVYCNGKREFRMLTK